MRPSSLTEALVAELEIRDVIARYSRAIDDGHPEVAASLFVPDGTLRTMGYVFQGWLAILHMLRESGLVPVDRPVTAHHTTNTVVSFDESPDSEFAFPFFATAQSDFLVIRSAGVQLQFLSGGRYRDRLRNTADGWRIEEREIVELAHANAPKNSP
jgi:hypothetical protein